MDLLQRLEKQKLIHPPAFLPDSVMYLARTGSKSYGVSNSTSDEDFVGFCIPPINVLFPHTAGELFGWDMNVQRFEGWQQHQIKFNDKVYDFNVYNIVKWFRLTADGNPNMIDSLFVKREDVVHSTAISELIRENRKLFLSKKCWHSFKSYAYSQMNAARCDHVKEIKEIYEFERQYNIPRTTKYTDVLDAIEKCLHGRVDDSLCDIGISKLTEYKKLWESGLNKTKRFEGQKLLGFDAKYLYHLVRLLDEVEQILTLEDLDLHRAKEHLKAIRRGDFSLDEVIKWAKDKEIALENAYANSTLPHKPREKELKELLLKCIEHHYGSLDKYIVNVSKEREILQTIANLVKGY